MDEKTAIVLLRVSTEEQAKGYSLEVQEHACTEYAKRKNLRILHTFREDGVSAKTMNRPVLQELRQFVYDNKVDNFLVHRVDRLSRAGPEGGVFILDLKTHKTILDSVTENVDETPMGMFMTNMLLSMAKLSNDERSRDTTNGMKYAFQQGDWLWRPPVGYEVVKTPEGEKNRIENSADARHIAMAFTLMRSGLHSQADVARILGEAGMEISPSSLVRILRNPFYAGIMVSSFSEEPVVGKNYEPIISPEDFMTVQRVLAGRKPNVIRRGRNNPMFPLAGLLECSECDKRLTGSMSTGRNGKKYGYYHCPKSGCQRVRKRDLEQEFIRTLERLQPKDDVAELFREVVRDIWKERKKTGAETEKILRRELKDLESKRQKIADLAIAGTFDSKKFREQDAVVARKIDAKNRELAGVLKEPDRVLDCADYCCHLFKNLSKLWEKGTMRVKKQVQGIVFPVGVKLERGIVRTTQISPILGLLGQENADKDHLVPPAEFESASPP